MSNKINFLTNYSKQLLIIINLFIIMNINS